MFIWTAILLAFDFWTMKNVAGRLLVGLRWWTQFKDDGTEEWIYESKDTEATVSACDSASFWYPQMLSVLLWLIFLIINVFGFAITKSLLNIMGLVMGSVNLRSFYLCSRQQKEKLKNLRAQYTEKFTKKAVDTVIQNPDLIQQAFLKQQNP